MKGPDTLESGLGAKVRATHDVDVWTCSRGNMRLRRRPAKVGFAMYLLQGTVFPREHETVITTRTTLAPGIGLATRISLALP